MALMTEPDDSETAPNRPTTISEKYSARAEPERHGGQRRGEGGQHQRADAAREEGADRGGGDGDARPALARHLVAVDHRHDRRGLARQVDEDRRGRAAIGRAVVDARPA